MIFNRSLAVVGVLCALLVTAGPAAAQPAGLAEDEPITHFSWTAPADFTGTFASTLRFDWEGGENDCTLSTAMSAAHGASSTEPMLHWLEWRTGGSDDWHGGTLAEGSLAHAHAGSDLDTESLVTNADGSVGYSYSSEGPFLDSLDMTFAAFNTEWDPRHSAAGPVVIDFECATPFQVSSLAAGLDGRSFTGHSLRGGTGASVAIPGVQVNEGDGLSHYFESSSVVFSFLDSVYQSASDGNLTLEHPAGTQSWATASLSAPFLSEGFIGGPGSYDVTLELVRAGVQSGLSGVLLGVDPVDSLDDVIE